MKAIDVIWFSPQGHTIGIVCAENDLGEKKFLLGIGSGGNEEHDAQQIADWGSKLDPKMINEFFNKHGTE